MYLKKGKLFVIEGLDGCGKETQAKLLVNNLKKMGKNAKYISFPNYNSFSSSLVKAYLNGKFGKNAELINPYQVSAFFAVDRVATYLLEMKDFLMNDGIVVCDRYVTSNILYQAIKIQDINERKDFLVWLKDFEYNKLGLPVPTKTFFLSVAEDTFLKNIQKRDNNKHKGIDIHEDNSKYLIHIYNSSKKVLQENDWIEINCEDLMGDFLKKEIINKEILNWCKY